MSLPTALASGAPLPSFLHPVAGLLDHYGYAAIAAFRAARSPAGLARTLSRTVITTYGRDHAVASTLFQRPANPGKIGRQMQTWVRFPEGWRTVAAHVSMIDKPRAGSS